MPRIVKNSSVEEDIKKIEKTDVVEIKKTPEEIYDDTAKRRKKYSVFVIIAMVLLELAVALLFVYEIILNDFNTRVVREFEIRSTGQVQLDSGTYSGNTDFGYFEGMGNFTFKTGASYSGNWENNQLKGIGKLNIPVEGNYEGDFRESKKNGSGVFSWDDGSTYSGEWKNDQMCGQGEYITSDNVSYIGTFKDNLFWTGKCTFENTTGNYVLKYKDGNIDNAEITFTDGTSYSGDCDTDNLTGTGVMKFSNGDIYTGAYSAGVRAGQGNYQWSSGDKYDGDWSEDHMSGTGTYTYTDGSYASGTFENNLFKEGSYYVKNDFGEYTFTISNGEATAVEMKLEDGTTYSGDITDGKLTGTAQIEYSNSDKYSGNVVDGRKSGTGIYTWTSGASYDGSWSDDKMNGTGTYMYATGEDGYKLTGTFVDGSPDGECRYYESGTSVFKTDWSNGRCVKVYE